jgi:hypothetical protein
MTLDQPAQLVGATFGLLACLGSAGEPLQRRVEPVGFALRAGLGAPCRRVAGHCASSAHIAAGEAQ